MYFPKQNHGLTVLAQCVICRGKKVNRKEVSIWPTGSTLWGPLDVLRAFRLGLQRVATRKLPGFSGVRTVRFCLRAFCVLQKVCFESSVPSSWWCCKQEPLHVFHCYNRGVILKKSLYGESTLYTRPLVHVYKVASLAERCSYLWSAAVAQSLLPPPWGPKNTA
jgi:hypothetical protein